MILCHDILGNPYVFEDKKFIRRKAAYGVYTHDNAVLLTQDAASGIWALPGGGLEDQETFEQALIREFVEETGLQVKDPFVELTSFMERFFDIVTQQPWLTDRRFYIVRQVHGSIRYEGDGTEISRVALVPYKDLHHIPLQQSTRNVLGAYFSFATE